MEFERYSTEMLAAETVADVMFHTPDMPWEFEFDSARHLYDEVRHCLIGYEWLRRRGGDPFGTPQFLQVFKWRTRFKPVEQYCMLTMGNEVNAFPYRHRRIAAHEESGDRYSEQQVRYDVADETQHVRFGRRWLPELVKASGDPRSEEKFTADMLMIWEKEYPQRAYFPSSERGVLPDSRRGFSAPADRSEREAPEFLELLDRLPQPPGMGQGDRPDSCGPAAWSGFRRRVSPVEFGDGLASSGPGPRPGLSPRSLCASAKSGLEPDGLAKLDFRQIAQPAVPGPAPGRDCCGASG